MEARKQQNYNRNSYYTEGNVARRLEVVPNYEEEQQQGRHTVKHVRKKARIDSSIDVFSLLLLTIAIITTLYTCIGYLQTQTNVTQMNKEIADLQSNLSKMKNENKDAEARLTSAIDLKYIYKVATKELGMVFPSDNQVIKYKSTLSDYVKQYKDIPEENNTSLLKEIIK